MVKLKGPSLALNAAGGLGRTLIYAESKGRRYAKKWHQPKNPQSASQVAMRAIVAFLSAIWSKLPTADTDTWTTRALETDVSPFNACLSFNLERWRRFEYPCTRWPPDQTLSFQGWASWTPTVLQRSIHHSMTTSTLNDGRGWMLHRQAGGAFTTRWDNLVHIIPCLPFSSPFEWSDVLSSGTYSYRARRISADAKLSAEIANNNLVIP